MGNCAGTFSFLLCVNRKKAQKKICYQYLYFHCKHAIYSNIGNAYTNKTATTTNTLTPNNTHTDTNILHINSMKICKWKMPNRYKVARDQQLKSNEISFVLIVCLPSISSNDVENHVKCMDWKILIPNNGWRWMHPMLFLA